jgi:hypothetical protein
VLRVVDAHHSPGAGRVDHLAVPDEDPDVVIVAAT